MIKYQDVTTDEAWDTAAAQATRQPRRDNILSASVESGGNVIVRIYIICNNEPEPLDETFIVFGMATIADGRTSVYSCKRDGVASAVKVLVNEELERWADYLPRGVKANSIEVYEPEEFNEFPEWEPAESWLNNPLSD